MNDDTCRLTINALICLLESFGDGELDPARAHEAADKALLSFIADDRVSKAFLELTRWYE